MSILINKDTKIITQGITGKTGQFHTRAGIAYANGRNCYVAGVTPKKGGQNFDGVPIFESVAEAKAATGATVSVIYVPPPYAAAAIDEAVDAGLDLVICITEGIPVRDMLEVRNKMKAKEAAGGKKTLLLGTNCPGLITPEEIKADLQKTGEVVRSNAKAAGGSINDARIVAQINAKLVLDAITLVGVEVVPLVDGHRERATPLGREPDQVRVLIRHVVTRVEHCDDRARVLDGFETLHDAVLLDGLGQPSAPPDAGGVEQYELPPVALARHVDAVARRTGLG